ncbi:innexin inx1 [Onthophagus taurus]|uniref:innexin inx1 n=1 Tax=Onthophagus taurus TaxID=166361 RepID=UPI000C20E06C|nr:innexin inx1 [Onthophagus taurus]
MYKLLGGLAGFLKYQQVKTDCALFRLHNQFTSVLLFGCSLIITASQYVGQPIQCLVDGLPKHVVNTYCWIQSTFTMPEAFRREIGKEVAHPGIANDFGAVEERKYYTYYQWVCFVLFFQGIACYLPHIIWKMGEGQLMRTLVMGMNLGICYPEEKHAKKKIVLEYLMSHIKRHNLYVIRYWICEALCLVNIIVQMYLMNKFFGGEFLSYGWKVMDFSDSPQENRVDPMVYVFPRVTKCLFHKYGATGTIQTHDSMCILPLNIVNEKTYIFIWFWYVILATALSLLIIYRVLIITIPKLRPRIMHAKNKGIPVEICQAVSRKVDLGDWWILLMLGTNMDPLIYREIISELAKKIDTDASNNQ